MLYIKTTQGTYLRKLWVKAPYRHEENRYQEQNIWEDIEVFRHASYILMANKGLPRFTSWISQGKTWRSVRHQ